jgi:hypothetical protein
MLAQVGEVKSTPCARPSQPKPGSMTGWCTKRRSEVGLVHGSVNLGRRQWLSGAQRRVTSSRVGVSPSECCTAGPDGSGVDASTLPGSCKTSSGSAEAPDPASRHPPTHGRRTDRLNPTSWHQGTDEARHAGEQGTDDLCRPVHELGGQSRVESANHSGRLGLRSLAWRRLGSLV